MIFFSVHEEALSVDDHGKNDVMKLLRFYEVIYAGFSDLCLIYFSKAFAEKRETCVYLILNFCLLFMIK